ncbi:MAG: nucleotidyltransferase domain-containing protein [Actinomycetota bacterium]
MKYTNPLDDILGQKSKVKILRYLSKDNTEASGRQIAADVKMSPTVCHRALNELVSQGIISTRRTGNIHLFRLNMDNYMVEKMLLPLFKKESGMMRMLAKEVSKEIREDVISIILFGSLARRAEEPYSDIDLLVVAQNAESKEKLKTFFSKRQDDFIRRFGNVLSPYIITRTDFKRRYQKNDPLIREAVKTGQLFFGKRVSEVLLGGSKEA